MMLVKQFFTQTSPRDFLCFGVKVSVATGRMCDAFWHCLWSLECRRSTPHVDTVQTPYTTPQIGPAQACGLICVGDVLVAVQGDRVKGMGFPETMGELSSFDVSLNLSVGQLLSYCHALSSDVGARAKIACLSSVVVFFCHFREGSGAGAVGTYGEMYPPFFLWFSWSGVFFRLPRFFCPGKNIVMPERRGKHVFTSSRGKYWAFLGYVLLDWSCRRR